MKKIIICLLLCTVSLSAQKIQNLYKKDSVSFRGLAVSESEIWASGSKGAVVRSSDFGKSWTDISPKGYESFDFRDIERIDHKTAVIMGVGSPGVILRTADAGRSWKEVFRDEHEKVFMDAMHRQGDKIVLVGDPIKDNIPYFLESKDAGASWEKYSPERAAERKNLTVIDGEAFFAASGKNVQIIDSITIVYATGGKQTHIYWWERNFIRKSILPMAYGNESAGANAIVYNPEKKFGFVVGGDFRFTDYDKGNITRFEMSNYGFLKFKTPKTRPFGYQSSVDYGAGKNWASCGLNGVFISQDDGENWNKLSAEPYHVLQASKSQKSVILAGSNGRIAKFEFK